MSFSLNTLSSVKASGITSADTDDLEDMLPDFSLFPLSITSVSLSEIQLTFAIEFFAGSDLYPFCLSHVVAVGQWRHQCPQFRLVCRSGLRNRRVEFFYLDFLPVHFLLTLMSLRLRMKTMNLMIYSNLMAW